MDKDKHDIVVVLDFGAINSQAAAKRIRKMNIYCEVLPYTAPLTRIKALHPKAIVLQRGAQCGEATLGREPKVNLEKLGLPILDMGTSYYDDKAMDDFLIQMCGVQQDWTTEAFIQEAIESIQKEVGGGRALLAMSGGVDSSVCAVLAHRALGDRLTCVYVDHGCMRKGESEEIRKVFKEQFSIDLRTVYAEERFLKRLEGVTDPEKKRKIIGEEFIRVFEQEAKAAGNPEYLIQGTIYPDIIESGCDGGKKVKAHHNVGGLPKNIDFKGLVEPLKYLFKDEVRKVAAVLKIPSTIALRQPFPGPGLAVRCIGDLTKEKLDVLREADAIFRKAIVDAGMNGKEASQFFAVLTGNRSVGVTNSARTYGYTIALRAVHTTDFMEAKFVKLPMDMLERVSEEITAKIPEVNRVVYDITSKPPSTIEWE